MGVDIKVLQPMVAGLFFIWAIDKAKQRFMVTAESLYIFTQNLNPDVRDCLIALFNSNCIRNNYA
jgi:hypothetical protein